MASINVGNYGLLNGLAEGVNSFINTTQALKDAQYKKNMGELLSGVQHDADGNLTYTPDKLAEIQAKTANAKLQSAQAERGQQGLLPDSEVSTNLQKLYKNAGLNVPEHVSAVDLKETQPVFKAKLGADAANNRMMDNPLTAVKQGQLDAVKDNQTSHAVDIVTKDPQLASYVQRLNGIERINSQIEAAKSGKFVDTSQLLADANAEYAMALQGSNNGALGKLERTEYNSTAAKWANIIQTIKGDPTSINSPKILDQIQAQTNEIKGNYQNALSIRGKFLKRGYSHNPEATKAQEDKIQELLGQYGGTSRSGGLMQGPQAAPQGGAHPQDDAAVAWAKNPNAPGWNKDKAAQILKMNGY